MQEWGSNSFCFYKKKLHGPIALFWKWPYFLWCRIIFFINVQIYGRHGKYCPQRRTVDEYPTMGILSSFFKKIWIWGTCGYTYGPGGTLFCSKSFIGGPLLLLLHLVWICDCIFPISCSQKTNHSLEVCWKIDVYI